MIYLMNAYHALSKKDTHAHHEDPQKFTARCRQADRRKKKKRGVPKQGRLSHRAAKKSHHTYIQKCNADFSRGCS